MKKVSVLSLCAGILCLPLLLTGCVSAADTEGKKNTPAAECFSEQNVGEAVRTAEDFVNAFAAAFGSNDYSKLPEDARRKISAEVFKKMVSRITERRGKLIGHRFVTELDQSIVRDYLWKFSFEKVLPDAGKRHIRSEVIYLVRMAVVDGVPTIVGFGFSR